MGNCGGGSVVEHLDGDGTATTKNRDIFVKNVDSISATCKRNGPVEKALVDQINIRDGDKFGFTPLIWCSWYGNEMNCKALLALNANVLIPDWNGFTSITYAASFAHTRILRLLLQNIQEKFTAEDRVKCLNRRTKAGHAPLDKLITRGLHKYSVPVDVIAEGVELATEMILLGAKMYTAAKWLAFLRSRYSSLFPQFLHPAPSLPLWPAYSSWPPALRKRILHVLMCFDFHNIKNVTVPRMPIEVIQRILTFYVGDHTTFWLCAQDNE